MDFAVKLKSKVQQQNPTSFLALVNRLIKKIKKKRVPKEIITQEISTDFKHPLLLRDGEPYDSDFSSWLITQAKPLTKFKGYNSNKIYFFVKNSVKKHIRSLLCLLYDVGKLQLCVSTETISEENMVIVHNNIKFKTLSLKHYSVTDSDDSFKKLGEFLWISFFKDIKKSKIPEDMRRLLYLLGESPSENERLIKNHISLMTDRGISSFICSWYNLQEQHTINQKAAYQRACSGLPYITNWQELIKGNDPFIFALGKTTYGGDPRDQPRFFRNCLQHILSECFRGKNGQMTQKPNFQDRDVVKMLVSIFHKSITIFPELLEREGLLKLSRPEECFY